MDFLKLPLVVQVGDPKDFKPFVQTRMASHNRLTRSLKDVIFAASDFGTQVSIRFQFFKHAHLELLSNLNDRFDKCTCPYSMSSMITVKIKSRINSLHRVPSG